MVVPMTAVDDGPAVQRGGDFEAFYRAHVDRIYRALAVTLHRDDLAHEAVDEAMARAYAKWSVVGGLDNPAGWVFRVGLNWATSWWRKVRRERAPGHEESHPGVGPPDGAVAAREALAGLPTAQRAVITCRVLLDLTTAETAVVLNLAEGTVKSRLSRGLAALRTALSDQE
jgi:DNA-directed RNA polymerase specialized sigma24 family protein